MLKGIDGLRRIVAGVGPDGKATVISDGPFGSAVHAPNGTVWGGIWRMGSTSTLPIRADQPEVPIGFPEIPGSQFTIVQLPPKDVGLSRKHESDTIDYIVVLAGQMGVHLEGAADFELSPGDCMVVGGCQHQYENKSDEPCVVVIVNVGVAREAVR